MNIKRFSGAALGAMVVVSLASFVRAEQVWLDELDLSQMSSGWNKPQKNLAVSGQPLTINGQTFARGVGTHALSSGKFQLEGEVLRFEADVGVDAGLVAERRKTLGDRDVSSVKFLVYVDGAEEPKVASPVLKQQSSAWHLSVDLAGAKMVELFVCDAMDGTDWDHADWANAFFTVKPGAKIVPAVGGGTQLGILTPKPSELPRINGPKVYGVRPGRPIIYRLPVTGLEPLVYTVGKLPAGVTFDAQRGVLTGAIAARGDYPIAFTAKNAKGSTTATVTFKVGDKIALTPPMGWNHWNCFAGTVTAEKIMTAADIMDKSEIARHGYSFVNIDDFWQNRPEEKADESLIGPERNADGTIAVNKRFPSMKALADYIHAKGFRAGLYSSPGPTTCGKCTGSWKHEWTDARTYAEWGFDYLKYDWCGYSEVAGGYGKGEHERMMLPYFLMGEALKAQNRDIVFSLCQYGMNNVSTWGARVGGNCWRTTGDILDIWIREDTKEPPMCWYYGIKDIIDHEAQLWPYAGPGAWNDPDMLSVGVIGFTDSHPTRLTPNEQYTHMSFWCILCSPLLIGCDLAKLDDFTLNLLCNDEVLETSQDPLGAQAAKVATSRCGEVWAKPMSDGSIVFALLNTDLFDRVLSVDFASLGLKGEWKVRDLWRQADFGLCTKGITAKVPTHATGLYRAWPQAGAGMCEGFEDVRMNWVYSIYDRGREVGKPGYLSPRRAQQKCADCPR